MLATLAGAAVITAAATSAMAATATGVGADPGPTGLVRLGADTMLLTAALTAALTAVAAPVVAWLRSTAAVAALSVFVGASYLLMNLVPLFASPDRITRTTIFGAFGNTYLEFPAVSGLIVLTVMAVAGGLLAAGVANRSPKAAS
jgi:hypothetical protein